jgi:DtxR family transcriptional regulator, Mn-dependent transcriptional regulator
MAETLRHPRERRGGDGPTEKMREYLEVIYYLAARNEPVIAARLAEWMHVTPPTVTDIVKRMEKGGYITRDARGEISLQWHQIHEEAVRLEHALSPTMEARIEALVSASTTCPHGNPIPGRGVGYPGDVRLADTEVGQEFTLRRIVEEAEEDSELIRYLQANNLVPGERFSISDRSASYGVTLRRDGQTITVSPQVAGALWGNVE